MKRFNRPSAVVNLLNSYFGTVADVIHAHHGFIDKYIGDAVPSLSPAGLGRGAGVLRKLPPP
jgi:class 3 adenylate cyclase